MRGGAFSTPFCRGVLPALLALAWCSPLNAQNDVFGAQAFDADFDLRASVVGGETSWIEGGFGKLRWGGDNRETGARLRVASADLAWKPQFSFNLSGLVAVTHQAGLEEDLDLSEAFVTFRSNPAPTRVTARAGIFWPPVSQEHSGSNWLVEDSITPSAANSWIGEEVKVLGLEAKVERSFGEHGLAATGALFLHNDMSGTFLTYRGWALHDLRVTPNSDLPLPPLSPSKVPHQAPINSPFWEVDKRAGYYARIDWEPPLPVTFNMFYYDNRGDRVSNRALQTSWRTRFWNAGAMATLDEATVAKAQALWGNTLVGPDMPMGIPADVDFATAYLLLSREVGRGKLTVRGDWFTAHDNSFVASDDNNEDGWALMLAYKRTLSPHAELVGELIHVASDRPARVHNAGIAAHQGQTMLQTALRIGF